MKKCCKNCKYLVQNDPTGSLMCVEGPQAIYVDEYLVCRDWEQGEESTHGIGGGNYIHEMKECIQALISAIDNSTFCKECCDKGCACSDCPWFKAKNRAFELFARKVEKEIKRKEKENDRA